MASSLSVSDFELIGSSLSLRNFAKLGSSCSMTGNVRVTGCGSVMDFFLLGSSLSMRSMARLVPKAPVRGQLKQNLCPVKNKPIQRLSSVTRSAAPRSGEIHRLRASGKRLREFWGSRLILYYYKF